MKITGLLWKLICYRPTSYACKPLIRLVCYAERIVFGLVIQSFFNALPGQTQLTPSLLAIFLPWLVAIALRLLIVYVATPGIIRFEFSANALLQHNLFQRILEQPGARAVPGSVGEAISHFRDDTSIVVELLGNLGETGALLVYAAVVFAILLHVNVAITLLVFIPLCAILWIARRAQKGLEKYRSASRAATSEVTGAIGEIFGAVQAIQVAGAEQQVVAHFNTLNDLRRSSMLKDRVMSGALNALFGNMVDLGNALILVLAALSFLSTRLRPGDLVLFITYIGLVTDCFNGIGSLLTQITQTRVSFNRLVALLQGATPHALVTHSPLYLYGSLSELPPTHRLDVQKLETLIVRKLSYSYPETGRGIVDANLHIEPGTLTVITGRIGSGKTTLLQTLLGLLPKDEGEIEWNGRPVADPATFFVPYHTAYTAQVPRLFSDTVRENILLGLTETEVDLQQAIHTAVLDDELATFEQELDTQIGVRGVKLSGGQVQRVATARMLVRTPELLVCDDLSSALDVETEQKLWERLFATGKCTCIAVSHRRAVLQLADVVIVLKNGRIEATGSLKELLTSSEEMHCIWQDVV